MGTRERSVPPRRTPPKEMDPLTRILSAERYALIRRYARLERDGRTLMMCKPGRLELEGVIDRKEPRGSDNKVIFNSRQAAEACARKLQNLPGGKPMKVYPCGRSRTGHHHIATDDDALYGRDASKSATRPNSRKERADKRRAAKRGGHDR